MRIKTLIAVLVASVIGVSAQNQGYKDGIEYYNAGQHDNARTILQRTLNESATDKALANYYLGQVALTFGNKDEARNYFETGKQIDNNNPYNYVGAGALALLNGNANAAEDEFKQARNLGKKDADVSVAIARAYYNANPTAYATQIDKNLAKARKDSKNAAPSIYILEGDMLADAGQFGDAAGRYEMALTYDANNPEGYVKYANAYFNVNRDFAIQKLEEYLNAHPESAMVQRELAEKYFKADRWKAASTLYGKYIKNPNHFPEDRARYSVLLYWGENYPESLQIANQILAQDPSNFLMQRVRMLNQEAMGDHAAAVASAEQFFASNPDANFTIKDYTTYADALSGLGQDSLAILQYEAAAEKFPKNGDLLKNLSSVYARNHQFVKSLDAYDAYIQLQETPSLTDLFGISGRCLNASAAATDSVEARDLANRGINYVQQVIERTSEVTPAMYQRLGHLYVARDLKKINADAIGAYDQMIALLDQNPENMNPQNPNNALNLYKQAYAFKQAFASMNGDKDGVTEWGAKYQEVVNLMEGNTETPAE